MGSDYVHLNKNVIVYFYEGTLFFNEHTTSTGNVNKSQVKGTRHKEYTLYISNNMKFKTSRINILLYAETVNVETVNEKPSCTSKGRIPPGK
jgi:hypothetical protein